ncbi:hypothetical protein [Xanthobacter agilis]|uniref:Uncharacterized protein n=1 Tax=Xanthobacter agilis TaxID=47492 RepID=A0ABU0LFP9_XANAG|nr:hypothetical protein [Xanthobacter agilis]MDQ0505956.1 hypothetical protein [Xanthobacter agilis]
MSEDDAGRSEAGYSAGRLFLRGVLKRWHHEAAKEYARLVHDYQISHGYPSPFPRSMDIGAVHGLSLRNEPDADIVRRVANQYMRCMTALADAGKAAASEVRNVCIHDEDTLSLDALILGLDSLVSFFGIPVDRDD